jgi:hypothetical protein
MISRKMTDINDNIKNIIESVEQRIIIITAIIKLQINNL